MERAGKCRVCEGESERRWEEYARNLKEALDTDDDSLLGSEMDYTREDSDPGVLEH